MTNRSGDKGTKAETAVVRWFRDNGFGGADRLTKTGNRDRGDVSLCPGIMAEVKNTLTSEQRGPTPLLLAGWMRETAEETRNGGWDLGILVVKRGGTSDVGRWWAFIEARQLAALVDYGSPKVLARDDLAGIPVCLDVADLARILRAAGWGDPL